MNKRIGISLAILMISVIILAIAIIIMDFKILNYRKNIIKEDSKPSIFLNETSDCKNMNLFNTSDCLNKDVRAFYKYNESSKGKNLSLDELKIVGGVCRHYADYYSERLKQLGGILLTDEETHFVRDNESAFYIKKIIISANKDINHVFVVVSNYEGYCNLDGKLYYCIKF